MWETLISPENWTALLKIIGVNIVLSGDNAVVIALACRSLPEQQRKKGVLFGSMGAIVLRIFLTFIAVYLLQWPYLKIIGSILLFWIALKLLVPDDEGGEHIKDNNNLAAAIKTIIIADVVMSLDNVLGVAAAANGNVPLIIFGLLISIPLIIFGSAVIMKLMDRFPVVITIGGALLGYVAGEMLVTDPALKEWIEHAAPWLHTALPIAGAIGVVALGKFLTARKEQKAPELIDLAEMDETKITAKETK